MLVVGLGVVIAVRLHEAKEKQASIATERTAAQALSTQRAPTQTVHPVATRWRPRVDVTGTLRPWREAEIGFELSGRLVQVKVAQVYRVKAGQVLGVLDGSRAAAEVSAAEAQARASEANLAIAEDNMRRTHALVASGSIPEAQETSARAQVALVRAQLEGAQANENVARTGQGLHTITALFDGVKDVCCRTRRAGRGPARDSALPGRGSFAAPAEREPGEDEAALVKVGAPVTVAYRDRQVQGP